MLFCLFALARLRVELGQAEVAVGDERAQAELDCQHKRLPVYVCSLVHPALIDPSGRVGVYVGEYFQCLGFKAPMLLGARQRHRLVRLFPRLGGSSGDEIRLGQEWDDERRRVKYPHRRARIVRLLEQRHRLGRASRLEVGGTQGRRKERKREGNLRRVAER